GLVLVRQRPGSGKGVIFLTLEDEMAIANIVVWPKVFERFRPLVLGSRFIRVGGRLQSQSGVIHIVAERIDDLSSWLGALSEGAQTAAGKDRKGKPSRQGFSTRPDGKVPTP